MFRLEYLEIYKFKAEPGSSDAYTRFRKNDRGGFPDPGLALSYASKLSHESFAQFMFGLFQET